MSPPVAMSFPAAMTAIVVDKILAYLAPLFLDATGDLAAAREAAGALLASFGARTDRELRLAALTLAFSFGALDALGRAANPELGLNQVMRLRGNANALNRAAVQNERRLEKLHRQAPGEIEAAPDPLPAADHPPDPDPMAADFLPTGVEPAELLAFTRIAAGISPASAPARETVPVGPLSRQQRRAMERQAVKVERRQQERARLADRAAQRTAAAARAI